MSRAALAAADSAFAGVGRPAGIECLDGTLHHLQVNTAHSSERATEQPEGGVVEGAAFEPCVGFSVLTAPAASSFATSAADQPVYGYYSQ